MYRVEMENPYKGASPNSIVFSKELLSMVSDQHFVTFICFASEQHQVFHNVTVIATGKDPTDL